MYRDSSTRRNCDLHIIVSCGVRIRFDLFVAFFALDVVWLDRIYLPLVTLWVFLGQVLSQDYSCRAAVARLIAHRISQE
jgi:hypothetical protein